MKKRLTAKKAKKLTKGEKIFLTVFTVVNAVLAFIVRIYDSRQLKKLVSDPEVIKVLENGEKTEKVS